MTPQQTIEYYRDTPSARWSALALVAISSFLTPLTLSATLIAIPHIAKGLNASAVYVSLIPAFFLVANLAMLLPAGRLADIYGRKKVFLIGSLIFVITSLLAGTSSSIEWLLFWRVFQGIGAAMFFSTGMAIVTSVFRSGGRGMAMGIVVASVYTGLSFGPLLGGILTDQLGWRWVFFGMAPFMLISIVLTLLKLKGEWRNVSAPKLDWLGSFLFALWIIVLFASLSNLPQPFAWILLGADAVLLLVFIQHTRRVENPLVNIEVVLKNRVLTRSITASLLMYAGNFSLIFLLSLYLQLSLGMTSTDAGKMMMVQAFFMAIMAPIAGKLSDHYPPALISTIGCFIVSIGAAALFFTSDTSPLVYITIALAVSGLGFGLFSTPNNSEALGSVSEEKLGIVSGIVNMARLMGQMLGTSLISLVISLHIGDRPISVEDSQALQEIYHWIVGFAFLFAIGATLSSWSKTAQQGQARQPF